MAPREQGSSLNLATRNHEEGFRWNRRIKPRWRPRGLRIRQQISSLLVWPRTKSRDQSHGRGPNQSQENNAVVAARRCFCSVHRGFVTGGETTGNVDKSNSNYIALEKTDWCIISGLGSNLARLADLNETHSNRMLLRVCVSVTKPSISSTQGLLSREPRNEAPWAHTKAENLENWSRQTPTNAKRVSSPQRDTVREAPLFG